MSKLIELRRTRAKSGELARTFLSWKNGKQLRKPYEIRGMVEVARTRANFDSEFLGGMISAKRKRRQRMEYDVSSNFVDASERVASKLSFEEFGNANLH